jgi:hypothetical protein
MGWEPWNTNWDTPSPTKKHPPGRDWRILLDKAEPLGRGLYSLSAASQLTVKLSREVLCNGISVTRNRLPSGVPYPIGWHNRLQARLPQRMRLENLPFASQLRSVSP